MRLPYRDGVSLILKVYEKTNKEKAWQRWLQLYPDMTVPRRKYRDGDKMKWEPFLKFISFDEYYEELKSPKISQRSAEEILEEAAEIKQRIAIRKAANKGGETLANI